ncbi:MAG: ketopantoate reductase family protein [Vicinamibacterales bacterium]
MRIVVYGAGAVGGFWGALLARAGHDVRFIARGAQLDALQARGLRIASEALGDIDVRPVAASAAAVGGPPADLVLLSVKTHQTPPVLEDLAAVVGPDTVLIPMQNGIDADDILRARWGDTHVLSAVVYVGAAVESPGVVRHAARGLLMLGNPYAVPADRFQAVLDTLGAPGLKVRAVEDIHRERWYKLMWNASFNAVSALTFQTTGPLLVNPYARQAIAASMRETAAVARASGVALSDEDVERSLAETEKLPPIRTSMLEDRERGRTMEVEALVGTVVRRGGERGVPTPVLATLYGLLAGMRPGPPPGPPDRPR